MLKNKPGVPSKARASLTLIAGQKTRAKDGKHFFRKAMTKAHKQKSQCSKAFRKDAEKKQKSQGSDFFRKSPATSALHTGVSFYKAQKNSSLSKHRKTKKARSLFFSGNVP